MIDVVDVYDHGHVQDQGLNAGSAVDSLSSSVELHKQWECWCD